MCSTVGYSKAGAIPFSPPVHAGTRTIPMPSRPPNSAHLLLILSSAAKQRTPPAPDSPSQKRKVLCKGALLRLRLMPVGKPHRAGHRGIRGRTAATPVPWQATQPAQSPIANRRVESERARDVGDDRGLWIGGGTDRHQNTAARARHVRQAAIRRYALCRPGQIGQPFVRPKARL